MDQSPEIQLIRNKLAAQGWPRFITNISISKLHGFNKNIIEFKFPICAVVGENGTGKSTLLKLLACAYESTDKSKVLHTSDFFSDTIWEKLQDINITYQIRLDQTTKTIAITKPTIRWRTPARPKNEVYYFDLSRIQPVESVVGYAKIAKRTIKETVSRNLTKDSIDKISEVMGKSYLNGRYAKTTIDDKKEIGILKFPFGEISRFHQGAGEAIISDIISAVEKIPDCSLVIIDELESSLHPKAQRRLIRQLLNLTRIKTLQIVLSTHSPYVLSELPQDSRILLTRTNEGVEVIYAPTVEFCLSQIDDKLHTELDILVEDDEAKCIVSEIVRTFDPEINDRIRILPAGPANVIQILANLAKFKKIPYPLLGIVDADQSNMTPAISLPGRCVAEKQVVQDIAQSHSKTLSQMLSLDEDYVRKELIEVQTIINHREWMTRLSSKFNISKQTLWSWLVLIWVKNCAPKEDCRKIISEIRAQLPAV